jgi:ABC-type dipeptide/oligopeptide/nickel transport system permease component
MVTFVVKRIGFMIFTMIIVSLILFLLLETELTGDPAARVLGQFSNEAARAMAGTTRV